MIVSRRQFIKVSSLLAIGAMGGCKDLGKENRGDFGKPVLSLNGDGFRLLVGDKGAMAVEVSGESYIIESSFSYPDGSIIGANELSCNQKQDSWHLDITVGKTEPSQICISGRGKHYTLTRIVSIEGSRVCVSDEINNETNEAVGIIIRHQVVTAEEPKAILFAGSPWASEEGGIAGAGKDLARRVLLSFGLLNSKIGYQAENPTLFVSLKHTRIGIIAEDTLSRLQFEAHRYLATFSLEHFALRPRGKHTLQWAIYPLGKEADYFTFINKVRSDWKTNFTIAGPWDFFDLVNHREIVEQPSQLREHLKRKRHRVRIVAFTPWLDYDHFDWRTGKTVGREEYKKLLRRGMEAFKAVDPSIKCLGCMQSCWRTLPAAVMTQLYEKIPQQQRKQGFYRFTDEQMGVAQDILTAWKDSFIKGLDGRYIYELYYTGPQNEPLMAIGVYAAAGNAQLTYWMDQAKFILEDVGLDGIYIDGFSLAFKADPSQRYTYDRWDGVTVDIDPHTGKIQRRYTDCAWGVVQAQKSLIEYVHSHSGILVANTAASALEIQSSPVMRFIEASGVMGHFDFIEGREPPLFRHLCRAQLGSPIALGWSADPSGRQEDGPEYSKKVMETVITYLRHGLLYYYYFYGHFGTQDPPTGSLGEDGAINHMFPITPTHIGKGFVVGKERIVTAVSGKFTWNMERKPNVLCFDIANQSKRVSVNLKKTELGWQVALTLSDWKEICVVE